MAVTEEGREGDVVAGDFYFVSVSYNEGNFNWNMLGALILLLALGDFLLPKQAKGKPAMSTQLSLSPYNSQLPPS